MVAMEIGCHGKLIETHIVSQKAYQCGSQQFEQYRIKKIAKKYSDFFNYRKFFMGNE